MTAAADNPRSVSPWAAEWDLQPGVTYLNHGSFGPSPRCVIECREEWSRRLERQPMDFFVREMEEHLDRAVSALAEFVGAAASNLVYCDNATVGMNVVAASVLLQPGDEVAVTDHEYGAVSRLWKRACRLRGAKVVTQKLPFPLETTESIVDAVMAGVTKRTRLIVVSHVTSPTAVILPVKEICRRAKAVCVPVCIDGPHALAMLPLNLREIDCDFYTASCHKWLCGPFGSGFLYVAPRSHSRLQPAVISWGGSVSGRAANWKDEFRWIGTRDPSAFLAVPRAIEFLRECGLDTFRQRSHEMARSFRERLFELTGLAPFVPDSPEWYGTMTAMPLPELDGDPPTAGQRDPLQDRLWNEHRIEIPVVHWQGRRLLRVSCHLYNTESDIDRLIPSLSQLLN
ncbi:MAG: aminotransferase class V-fold PLP-dependent enzyme, partial [Planctomycetes bacterium]|nr:aminotransferase class V-fold PLP-dependent enzyme [Planctomycetota bacterium]